MSATFEPGQYRSGAPFLASAEAEVSWTGAGHAFARTGVQVGGDKVYELRDHLGNVAVVVSDRKLGVDGDSDGVAEGFGASIVSARDFYPYGMVMPGRSLDVPGYRYGFNGKEMDDEVNAAGLHVDFGARGYDPRLGQWMAVDPLAEGYPSVAPYSFVVNCPLIAIDPDGKLIIFISGLRTKAGNVDQNGGYPIPRITKGTPWPGIYRDKGGEMKLNYSTDLRNYWKTNKNAFGQKVDMVDKFNEATGDYSNVFISGSSWYQSQADDRAAQGAQKAELFHQMVQSGEIILAEDETIKLVSHSQGGAHAAGFAKKLMEYKDENGKNLYTVEVSYYITAHQSGDIEHPEGIRGVQYSNINDMVSSTWNPLPNGGSELAKIQGVQEAVISNILPGWWNWLKHRGGHNNYDNTHIFKIPKGDPGFVAPGTDIIQPE